MSTFLWITGFAAFFLWMGHCASEGSKAGDTAYDPTYESKGYAIFWLIRWACTAALVVGLVVKACIS
jgi:hypothetical protein